MVEPYCSQSSLTFYGLSLTCTLGGTFGPRRQWTPCVSYFQCSAVNIIRSISSFQDSCPSLWRGCINTLVSSRSRCPLHATEGERGCPREQWCDFPKHIRIIWNYRGGLPTSMEGSVEGSLGGRWAGKARKTNEVRATDQREAGLERGARQPRLTMEADGSANTKTRERTEGAASAVPAMHGDSCTAQMV